MSLPSFFHVRTLIIDETRAIGSFYYHTAVFLMPQVPNCPVTNPPIPATLDEENADVIRGRESPGQLQRMIEVRWFHVRYLSY